VLFLALHLQVVLGLVDQEVFLLFELQINQLHSFHQFLLQHQHLQIPQQQAQVLTSQQEQELQLELEALFLQVVEDLFEQQVMLVQQVQLLQALLVLE
jgi:hypothetical protein